MDASSPDHSRQTPIKSGEGSSRPYFEWYRLALLLTGKEGLAREALRVAIAESALEFGQLRNKNSRRNWLARKVIECSQKLQSGAGSASEASESEAPTDFAAKVAALPEPDRSAFALFHCVDADPGELAELIGVRESRFSEILARARHALAPELSFPDADRLRLHRPWGGDLPGVAKAVRAAAGKPEIQMRLAAQAEFDRQCHAEIDPVQIPGDLALPEFIEPPSQGWRTVLRQPAVLSIGIAVLVVLGVVVYFWLHKLDDFPGKDIVVDLVEEAGDASGADLTEAPASEVGKLGDWFLLNGYEYFAVPPELGRASAVGVRVYQYKGEHPVAQIGLRQLDAVVFVFRGSDMKVGINTPKWHIFQQDEWAVAARGDGENCYVVAFRGDCDDMEKFLTTVGK